MILILMFMADSISATRIYSSMALPNLFSSMWRSNRQKASKDA
ncbi:hypothetical protein NC653_010056 [Populus alba x Populus x berolinensis]|nr:hypothetical protein NC653_010056 [Populus alba x Populus x berolinensis]